MNQHLLGIWDGISVPQEVSQRFRRQWLLAAGLSDHEHSARTKCPHLWKRVRDAQGAVVMRQCQTG